MCNFILSVRICISDNVNKGIFSCTLYQTVEHYNLRTQI